MKYSVHIGTDRRELPCYLVANYSLCCNYASLLSGQPCDLLGSINNPYRIPLTPSRVRLHGYDRPVRYADNNQLWDDISDAPMSTEFAINRFMTPILAKKSGVDWALFVDCDVMFRDAVWKLFADCDDSKAVMCVQHHYEPPEDFKMDDQLQVRYARKNWSSVMAFNLNHSANDKLTVDMINSLPGRDLHRFCWLEDDEIGALDPRWNYLVGHTSLPDGVEPAIVHWTEGAPCFPAYANAEYADEFWEMLWHAVEQTSL